MKTTIKRFLLILPVMFCMVLGLAVPAVSSAYYIQTWNGSFAGTFTPYSSSLSDFEFRSDIASMISSCSADVSQPYIAFSFCSQDSSVLPTLSYYSCSAVFACQSEFGSLTYHTDFYNGFPLYIFDDTSYGFYYSRFSTDGHSSDSQSGMWRNIYGFSVNPTSHELIIFDRQDHISTIIPSGCIYEFESNLPELSNNLDVSVEFQPNLSGSVDRTITNGSGASGLSQGFNMTVSNNGRVPCQYRMAIFEGTSILAYPSGGIYSDTDNCIYAYLTKQWVMAADISTMRHIYSYETATKQFTSCNWHYLAAGATDEQFFKFSQINFKPNVEYTVIVEAVPNSGGMTSIYFTGNTLARGDGEHAMDSSFEQYILSNDDIEVVHRSTFTIPNLSDVTYNPDDSSNGLIPNSSHEDYARAINTRDAYEKEDGTIDYSSYNAYDDPNSWINDPKIKSSEEWYALGNTFYDDGVTSLSYSGSSFGSGFVPASVGSLGTGVANFGLFLTSVFGLLPPAFSSLLTIGLITIVIIGIIKAVK